MMDSRLILLCGSALFLGVSMAKPGQRVDRSKTKSGLCPQPNCRMDGPLQNCAPSYDCCNIGGSKFCVPTPCPKTATCSNDYDCAGEEDKCCPTSSKSRVCTHAVFMV